MKMSEQIMEDYPAEQDRQSWMVDWIREAKLTEEPAQPPREDVGARS